MGPGDIAGGGTVIAMVVTSIAAFGAGVLNYLAGRDRLKFDTEKHQLEKAVARLETEVKRCEEERDNDRKHMEELDVKAKDANIQAAKLEGEVISLRAECERNRVEIDQLRSRMYGGDTGRP
jgi:peptidoglycan hydrolase CwlO-like protein